MPEKQESTYEDSYQKRKRLEKELKSAIDDIKKSFDVYKKDASAVSACFKRCDSIVKRIGELAEQERELDKELKEQAAKNVELEKSNTPMDEKIDSSAKIYSEISSTREKIIKIWEETESLIKEMDKLVEEEQPGQIGDWEGTVSIIKMNIQRIEELKRQLDELNEQDNF